MRELVGNACEQVRCRDVEAAIALNLLAVLCNGHDVLIGREKKDRRCVEGLGECTERTTKPLGIERGMRAQVGRRVARMRGMKALMVEYVDLDPVSTERSYNAESCFKAAKHDGIGRPSRRGVLRHVVGSNECLALT